MMSLAMALPLVNSETFKAHNNAREAWRSSRAHRTSAVA
jgi:hypothetical protein